MDLFYPASREASRIFISHIAWEIPWIRTGFSWYGCAGAAPAGAGAVPAGADVVPEESREAPAGAGATSNRAGAALSGVAPAGTGEKCIQI